MIYDFYMMDTVDKIIMQIFIFNVIAFGYWDFN